MVDRVEVNRALAKAIAYKACGKDRHAADITQFDEAT